MRRRRKRWYIILLLLASAAVYLVGNASVSLWDRDEPRYAQTSAQMLQSGDWVVPRLLDEPREKKPVFIYWCQAASMALLGTSAFAARLPSVVGVTLTLVVLSAALWGAVGPRRTLWTVFIFATAGLTIAAAKMCITDGVLILFVTVAKLCLYRMWRGRGTWPTVIICGLAVGLGLLTKGPVALGIIVTTALALLAMRWIDRDGTAIVRGPLPVIAAKWLVGISLAAAIVAPWLWAIERRLPGHTLRTLKAEVFERARRPQEGHRGPPGYYLLTIWGTYFPWSLLLPAAIVHAWKRRRVPQVRFALAAVVGPWVMFELVQTKLPHYLLPTFPALAFLTADMLLSAARKRKRSPELASPAFLRAVLIWSGVAGVLGAAPWLSLAWFGGQPRMAMYAMVALTILSAQYARSVYAQFRARRPLDAAAVMGVGMMVLVSIGYGLYLPNAPFLRISQRVADVLKAEGATRPGDAIMIDYKETSLAFYQGGTIRPQPDDQFLVRTSPTEWPRWTVMTDAVFRNMPEDVKSRLDTILTVRGLNYAGKDAAGSHVVAVHVLRKKSAFLPEP